MSKAENWHAVTRATFIGSLIGTQLDICPQVFKIFKIKSKRKQLHSTHNNTLQV